MNVSDAPPVAGAAVAVADAPDPRLIDGENTTHVAFARRNLTDDAAPPSPPPGVHNGDRTVLLMLYFARKQLEQRELGIGQYNDAKEMMASASLDEVLRRVLGLTPDRQRDEDEDGARRGDADFDPVRDVEGWSSDRCESEIRGLEAVAGRRGAPGGSRFVGSEQCLAVVQILRGLKDHPEALPLVEAMYRKQNNWEEEEKERKFRKKAADDCCAVCLEVLLPASNYTPRWERRNTDGDEDDDEGYPLPICSLPCGHRFHGPCIESVRSSCSRGLLQACPACRTDLPQDPIELFGDALKMYHSVRDGGNVVEREIGGGRAGNYPVWDMDAMNSRDSRTCSEYIRLWKAAAEQGQLKAMHFLGHAYYYGEGAPHDSAEAARWYKRAAEHGHAPSQQLLGFCYQEGFGVDGIDEREAAKWYRRAAEQGNATGQYALGSFYCKGIGVPPDDERAVYWHRKAAEQGCVESSLMMGVYYKNGVGGLKRNYSESMRWFAKADDKGHPEAANDIRDILAMRKAEKEGGRPLPPLGARVRLTGLKAKPELNGRTGVMCDFATETGRCVVQLETEVGKPGGDGLKKVIKVSNLEQLTMLES